MQWEESLSPNCEIRKLTAYQFTETVIPCEMANEDAIKSLEKPPLSLCCIAYTRNSSKFFRCSALLLHLATAVCDFLYCEILRNHRTNSQGNISQWGPAMTALVQVEEASVVVPSSPFSFGHEEAATQPEQKHQLKILLWAWFFCGTCPKAPVFQPMKRVWLDFA